MGAINTLLLQRAAALTMPSANDQDIATRAAAWSALAASTLVAKKQMDAERQNLKKAGLVVGSSVSAHCHLGQWGADHSRPIYDLPSSKD